jgi:hypothetical protein
METGASMGFNKGYMKNEGQIELGDIVFGTSDRNGELVIYHDRIEVYICERKYYAPPLAKLRAAKFIELPIYEISHISYDSGSLPLKSSLVEIFLNTEKYQKKMAQIKAAAGGLASLIKENAASNSFVLAFD